VRSADEIETVLQLCVAGLTDKEVSDITRVPRRTVSDWRRGNLPSPASRSADLPDLERLPTEQYAYLLGIYLGDGCLTSFPRGVWKLRVFCDAQYSGIIEAVAHAMAAVKGSGTASIYPRRGGCVEVAMYWKHWARLFPQHGPGPKWQRDIRLADWQQAIVDREREAFLCGLIDSDGCRIIAIYRERDGKSRAYGRYVFSNRSEQIHRLFGDSLDALGIHWTRANFKDIAVARQRDVRELDRFIGPKE
jgi:hypothetical protein